MQNSKAIKILLAIIGIACIYEFSFTYFTRQYEKEAEELTNSPQEAREWLKENSDEVIWMGETYMECKKREINLGLDLRGGVSVTLEIAVDELIESMVGQNIRKSPKFRSVMKKANELKKQQAGGFIELFVEAYNQEMNGEPMAKWFAGFEDINANSTNEEVIEVLNASAEDAVGQAKEVIRTRVSQFGVAQPDIKLVANTGRIIVDLPGVKDVKRVEKLLQGSAVLEIWDTYEVNDLVEGIRSIDEIAKNYEDLNNPLDSADFEGLLSEDSAALVMKRNAPFSSLILPQSGSRATIGQVKIADTAKVNKYLKLAQEKKVFPKRLHFAWSSETDLGNGSYLNLYTLRKENDGKPYMSGEFISSAERVTDEVGRDFVSLNFKTGYAYKWEQITAKSAAAATSDGNGGKHGKPIAIVLDGLVYSAPGAAQAISGGRTQITPGSMENTTDWANDLANVLNAGKFPAPAKIVQLDFVGPTLGAQSVSNAVWSFIIALILVLIYMVFYYNTAGWVANVALLVNIVFIIGVLASFPTISLTLPGVAGIVLTVGMSVDANVLIYERIREELKQGKGIKLAISDGYKHAYTAILDANITTLITGIILWYFGTSVIESFAQTLVVGIFTSLISAIFVTRIVFDWLLKKEKSIKFSSKTTENWFANAKYNIISSRKKFYVGSGLLILVGLISIASRGFNLGIDFEGGRTYKVGFEQAPSVENVRDNLSKFFVEDGKLVDTEIKSIETGEQLLITTEYLINDDSKEATEKVEDALYNGLKEYLPEGLSKADFINPTQDNGIGVVSKALVESTIADDIISASYTAVLVALFAIFAYVAFRFRQWQFGLGALIAIFHDVAIVLGLFSILQGMLPFSLEINTAFVAAILTVVGYSINDTVVVFDRVRERVAGKKADSINVVVNKALNSTLSRTFNTSMTIFVVLLAILLFGGSSLQGFAFALLIGVVVGTYSSICIASPIYTDLVNRQNKKK